MKFLLIILCSAPWAHATSLKALEVRAILGEKRVVISLFPQGKHFELTYKSNRDLKRRAKLTAKDVDYLWSKTKNQNLKPERTRECLYQRMSLRAKTNESAPAFSGCLESTTPSAVAAKKILQLLLLAIDVS